MKLHPRPVVIVGMQRSGTSALAGALAKLGLFFGKEGWLYPADQNNRDGYFEHRKATVLNLKCLETYQMNPTSFNSMPANWYEHPLAVSIQDELRDFILGDFSKKGRWGIKQPVTSLVLPLYNHVFDKLGLSPHYVLCVRNPLETLESEAKLDFGDSYRVMASLGKRAIGSWMRYTLGSFADAAGRTLTVVPYDDLLSTPARMLESIVSRHSDWSPSPEMWSAAIGSIRTDLRHNRIDIDRLSEFPSLVGRTFRSAIAFDDSDPRKREEVLALHKEFCSWAAMLYPSERPAGKLGLAWLDGSEQRISEVGYVPNGEWQTVRLLVDAPPRTNVSGLLYGWPSRIWIRRSVWKAGEKQIPATIRTGIGSNLTLTGGIYRLDAVFEPNQIALTTPGSIGPYELELEFLLESGRAISQLAAAQLAAKLEQSASAIERLTSASRGVR